MRFWGDEGERLNVSFPEPAAFPDIFIRARYLPEAQGCRGVATATQGGALTLRVTEGGGGRGGEARRDEEACLPSCRSIPGRATEACVVETSIYLHVHPLENNKLPFPGRE